MDELSKGKHASALFVKKFLDDGADINFEFKVFEFSVFRSALNIEQNYRVQQTAFTRACMTSAPLEVIKLLLTRGANVDFPVLLTFQSLPLLRSFFS